MYRTTTSIKNKDDKVIPFDSLGTQNKLQKNTAEEKKKKKRYFDVLILFCPVLRPCLAHPCTGVQHISDDRGKLMTIL